ncbi:hypothetical protein AAU57_06015 [Nonlabens sp. YIK11]|nr:hypothetical protein AAU57_06015 [Nonlabens sp. YIK11]
MIKKSVLIIYILFSIGLFAQTDHTQIFLLPDAQSIQPMDTIFLKKTENQISSRRLDSIKINLIRKGYLNLIIADTLRKNTNQLSIVLNKPFTTIIMKEDDNMENGIIMESSLSRKRPKKTTPDKFLEELEAVQKKYNNQGSPFAEVIINRWNFTKQDTATLFYEVKNIEQRQIDRIIVNGYPKYPRNVIENLVANHTKLNSKNVNRLSTRLANLKYLESIKEPEALFKKDSTLLYVYLRKKNANKADGLIGFNTDEDGKLNINGFVDASLINNFNRGERFDFEYRNDNNDQTNISLQLNVPSLLFERIGITSSLDITRRDSIYQNSSFVAGLSYQFLGSWNTQLNYYSKSSTEENNLINVNNFQTRGVATQLTYGGNSANTLQPETLSFLLGMGYYHRNLENQSNGQYSMDLSFENLWPLLNKLSLKTSINAHLLKTERLQFNELTQIGGIKTIRGFNQNSIDTAAYTLLQTDFRYSFNDRFYINLLNDGGVFEDYIQRKPQFLYSFGAGFGILTQAGILRLEVANGRFLSSNESISNTIAHLNFTILF